jgi:enamine deaminase RidA (YjgF/YER057c/UK114 family)
MGERRRSGAQFGDAKRRTVMQQVQASATTASVTLLNPAGLYDPSPYCYSHVATLRGDCRAVYIAGQGGENEKGELSPDFRTQVRQALHNLRTALKAAGASTADVAKLTVLIVDHTEDKLRVFGSELKEVFGPGPKPACTLIPVPRLALDAMLVEVEAIAAVRA